MKTKLLTLGLWTGLAAFSITVQAATLENLDTLKQNIVKYHQSGQYEFDVAHVINQAKSYLSKRIRENKASSHPKKLAIVLDIDETSLSNYHDLEKLGFGGTSLQQNKAEGRADDTPINSTLALYKFAKENGVTVFFITGRKEMYRDATVKNLKDVGYSSWAQLNLKPNNYSKPSVVDYKQSRRKAITQKGYDIVINIGDQYSDLAGGYSDRTYKLPDYMYYIA